MFTKTLSAVDDIEQPIHIHGVIRSCILSPLVSFVGGGVVAWITGQGIQATGVTAVGVALTSVLIHTLATTLLQWAGEDYAQKVHPYTHAGLCSLALASSALLWHIPFSWPAGVSLLLPFFSAKMRQQEAVSLRHVPLLAWFA